MMSTDGNDKLILTVPGESAKSKAAQKTLNGIQ